MTNMNIHRFFPSRSPNEKLFDCREYLHILLHFKRSVYFTRRNGECIYIYICNGGTVEARGGPSGDGCA